MLKTRTNLQGQMRGIDVSGKSVRDESGVVQRNERTLKFPPGSGPDLVSSFLAGDVTCYEPADRWPVICDVRQSGLRHYQRVILFVSPHIERRMNVH